MCCTEDIPKNNDSWGDPFVKVKSIFRSMSVRLYTRTTFKL